jgi:hypothetical protein
MPANNANDAVAMLFDGFVTLNRGDLFRLMVVGNVLAVYINGQQVASVVDTQHLVASGDVGIFLESDTDLIQITNFTAGDAGFYDTFQLVSHEMEPTVPGSNGASEFIIGSNEWGMKTRQGESLFLKVDVGGETVRVFGHPEELAERLERPKPLTRIPRSGAPWRERKP